MKITKLMIKRGMLFYNLQKFSHFYHKSFYFNHTRLKYTEKIPCQIEAVAPEGMILLFYLKREDNMPHHIRLLHGLMSSAKTQPVSEAFFKAFQTFTYVRC